MPFLNTKNILYKIQAFTFRALKPIINLIALILFSILVILYSFNVFVNKILYKIKLYIFILNLLISLNTCLLNYLLKNLNLLLYIKSLWIILKKSKKSISSLTS